VLLSDANPFVGRLDALDALARWGDEAAGGQPRLIVLSGPAGVGKSRLLARYVESRATLGEEALLGSGHEGVDLPFLALVSALRPLLDRARGDASWALRDSLLGAHAHEDTDDQGGAVEEARRLALFFEASSALVDAARGRPVVLALDDLQWVDEPSTELLWHLSSTLAQEGMVHRVSATILVAVRSGDVPAHVARLLERLQREQICRRANLDGLTELETNQLLSALLGRRPSGQLLFAVQESTRGNPLFVRSLLETLIDGDHLSVRQGVVVADDDDLVGLPSDLDSALRSVIDRVSPEAHELARRAAYLGDEGQLDDLKAVARDDETAEGDTAARDATTARELEELTRNGLLAVQGDRFRFAHAQIRHLLYHEPFAGRRDLHLLIADRLERNGPVSGDRAIIVAHHLRRAGPDVDPPRLLAVAGVAGRDAFAVGAWAKAARYLGVALEADDAGHVLDPTARAELEHRMATASYRDHDLPATIVHARRAVELARAGDDLERWGAALGLALRAGFAHGPAGVGGALDTEPIEEFLLAAGDDHAALRARLLGEWAEMAFAAFEVDTGRRAAQDALELAAKTGDQALIGDLQFALGLAHLGAIDLDAARSCFEASADAARLLHDRWQQAWGQGRLPLASLAAGELERTGREVADVIELTHATHDWAERSLAVAIHTALAVAQGNLAEVESLASEAEQLYDRSEFAFTPAVLYPVLALARARRGNSHGAREALDRLATTSRSPTWRYRLSVEAALGDDEFVLDAVTDRPYAPSRRPLTFFTADTTTTDVDVAVATGDAALAGRALERLLVLRSKGLVVMPGSASFVPRLIGEALTAQGQLADARRELERAQADAARRGLRVEEALCGFGLARLLVEGDDADRRRARVVLDRVMSRADELGLLPLLQRSNQLLADLSGRDGPGGELTTSRPRVILVSDLVGSTELNLQTGDERWGSHIARHDRVVRECLRRHNGVEFKHTGDGMCAWFDDAAQAIDCARAISEELDRSNLENPDVPLVSRFGLAMGQPIVRDGDFFGLAVVMAARLCAEAAPSSLLASADVARVGQSASIALVAAGERRLKGFPDPVPVYLAAFTDA
jgi:class 3 adenylate cyclase